MTVLLKRFLLLLLLAVVLVPVLQAKFHFAEERKLFGAFVPAPRAVFSWSGLRDNSFQAALENYLEDRMGFRSFFIQVHNQLRFSLFQVSTTSAVVVGRQGIVFQDAPMFAYLGQDSVGRKQARVRVKRLRRAQQVLAERGIPLLFVMAPNKARQLPQFLPALLPEPKPGQSNYEVFTSEMRRQGVELLNLTPLFTAWADTARYPLFPWSGTHWSAYGATLSADTILKRVEYLTHTPIPRLQPTGLPLVTTVSNPIDGDLTTSMNLLFPPKGPPAVYPQMGPAPARPGEKRLNLLLVGDSFNWGLMFFSPFIQHAFAPESRFWYGSHRIAYLFDSYEHKDPVQELVDQLDFRQQVESRQVIIILITEHNLPHTEFGFTQQVLNLYHPLTAADNARIAEIEQALVRKQPWAEGSKPGFAERMHDLALATYYSEQ